MSDFTSISFVSSAFVFVVLNLLAWWIYSLRKNDERHQAFALFLIAWGASILMVALGFIFLDRVDPARYNATFHIEHTLNLLAGWALVWMILHFPADRGTPKTRQNIMIAATAVLLFDVIVTAVTGGRGLIMNAEGARTAYPWFIMGGIGLLMLPVAAFLFSRSLRTQFQEVPHRSTMLIALALTAYPLFRATRSIYTLQFYNEIWEFVPASAGLIWPVILEVALLLGGVLALVAAFNIIRYQQRAGGFPIGTLLFVAAGPLLQVLTTKTPVELYSFVELAFAVMLVYAMARYRLSGLDGTVRRTIARSSVAVVFIAVFFIASEAATEYFGNAFNSEYYGIGAAGLLVLAIAPLQRVADRFAHRAIPLQEPGGREAAFKTATRAALRDGIIERTEEFHLADLAGQLGLSPKDALLLREQVEQEHAGSKKPPAAKSTK